MRMNEKHEEVGFTGESGKFIEVAASPLFHFDGLHLGEKGIPRVRPRVTYLTSGGFIGPH